MTITLHGGSLIFWLLGLGGLTLTFWLRSTTTYDLKEDSLIISRGGWVWMEIPFADIEAVLVQPVFVDRFLQVRLCKFPPLFGRMTRIQKRSGFRYVFINPGDPQNLIDAWRSYQSAHALSDSG